MRDITEQSMSYVMRYAPVWAAAMAGRTRVFETDVPTAQVSASSGRFKIEVNPKFANDPFILLHEIAHIFRDDCASMLRYPHMAKKINVAADCIINDNLLKAGVPVRSWVKKNGCWGMDIYKRDCSDLSINSLLKMEIPPEATGKASAPSPANAQGEDPSEELSAGESPEGNDPSEEKSSGIGENSLDYIGTGGMQLFDDPKVLAQGVAGYVRRMLFPTGFKSRNLDTKMDWRRQRSAFASRTDVVIPRLSRGEVGHTYRGPLINLVLDVSGSMNQTWVQTAATIANEISNARLDFDLWLTPSRRKSKNPKATLDALLNGVYGPWAGDIKGTTTGISHPACDNYYDNSHDDLLTPGRPYPTPRGAIPDSRSGPNELRALAFFETENPIAWIYIGDYQSSIDFEFQVLPNFIHIPIAHKGFWGHKDWMKKKGLPHFPYKATGR